MKKVAGNGSRARIGRSLDNRSGTDDVPVKRAPVCRK